MSIHVSPQRPREFSHAIFVRAFLATEVEKGETGASLHLATAEQVDSFEAFREQRFSPEIALQVARKVNELAAFQVAGINLPAYAAAHALKMASYGVSLDEELATPDSPALLATPEAQAETARLKAVASHPELSPFNAGIKLRFSESEREGTYLSGNYVSFNGRTIAREHPTEALLAFDLAHAFYRVELLKYCRAELSRRIASRSPSCASQPRREDASPSVRLCLRF